MSKISELSDGGVIQGGDTLIAVRSGGNVKVTYGGSTTANIDGGTIDGTVIGGSTAAAGSFTTLTATGIDVTGNVTLESSDAGAGEGPEIFLHRNSASPAASDVLGVINFDGENSAGSQHTYGKIKGVIVDPTNTSEDGKLVFQARGAGAGFSDIMTVASTGIDVTGTVTADGLSVDGAVSVTNVLTVPVFSTTTIANTRGLSIYNNQSGGFLDTTLVYGNSVNSYFAVGHHNGTSYAERMRIDSSGNVMVGKSASSFTTAGVELASGGTAGKVQIQRSSAPLALVNLTDDGTILSFYKGTTPVGSIGTKTDSLFIHSPDGTNGAGLKLSDGVIVPCNSDGTGSDNDTDFGNSGARFKDLYLSGGVYLGGTGAANLLDDYEEGTWTPVFSGSGYSFSNQSGTYTKIGRQVFIRGNFTITTVGSDTSFIPLSGLPFTVSSAIVNGHFIGTARETLSNGAMFVVQANASSTSGAINSMDGVTTGDNHVFTVDNYAFCLTYEV